MTTVPRGSQGSSVNSSARPSRAGRRRLRRLSGYLVVLVAMTALGGIYTAFGAGPGSAAEHEGSSQSMAVREGRELYVQGCSTCHGLNLQGGAGGPSLVGVGEASVIFQVESGRMPLAAGFQQAQRKPVQYTQAQVDQLAAYIQSVGGGVQLPEGSLTDGDIAEGGDLFRTNCASCHNFAGSGGALTYGKYAPDLGPASPRVIMAAMLSGPESMPRYSNNQLTVEEKKAITNYVRYVTRASDPGGHPIGRFGPIPEGLVAWLVGMTSLVGFTLWIGARA